MLIPHRVENRGLMVLFYDVLMRLPCDPFKQTQEGRSVTIIVRLVILYFFLHISILLHELGHYLTCKCMGILPASVRLGTGHKLIEFNIYHTVFSVRLLPISGQCVFFHHTRSNLSPHKQFILYLMGPLTNLIGAVVGLSVVLQISFIHASGLLFNELVGLLGVGLERLVAGTVTPFESSVTLALLHLHPLLFLWLFINIFLCIVNLIPVRASDGEMLITAILQGIRAPIQIVKFTLAVLTIFSFLLILVIFLPGIPIVEVVPQKRLIAYLLLITLILIGDSVRERVKYRREVIGDGG